MLSKKLRKLFAKKAEAIIQDSIESEQFHNRIENEIAQEKKQMEERRKNFRLIRNK
jgi:hypothetical protein